MPGNPTSLTDRTRYRVRRALRRLSQRVRLVAPQEPFLSAQAFVAHAAPGDPKTFTETDYGSGAYGKWILDENELPAYRYEIDQFTDEAAAYPVSEGAFRRDHWHQVGNERINALASNHGTVQVIIGDRGWMYLNYFNAGDRVSLLGAIWQVLVTVVLAIPRFVKSAVFPAQEPGFRNRLSAARRAPHAHSGDNQEYAFAGGFAYLDDGQSVWSTAYRYSPDLRPQMERVFGMGYYQTITRSGNTQVTRRVYAPAGDVPALLVDVEVANTGTTPLDVSYYEYWDVNVQQLPFQAFRSGIFASAGDARRRDIDWEFKVCLRWDTDAHALRFQMLPTMPAPTKAQPFDPTPSDIFLADLSGVPDGIYTDKAAFFGSGGAERPDGIGTPGESTIASFPDSVVMPYCMVLRHDLHIEPGESTFLRFAYGTVESQSNLDPVSFCADAGTPTMPQSWHDTFGDAFQLDQRGFDPFTDMVAYWKARLAYFSISGAPYLQREIAWHAYYLQSSTLYHEYFGTRIVPQGSAYLYLQGLDGVPRDFSLFVLPLIYLDPSLARDMLKLIMEMTDAQAGQIAYGYVGSGQLTGALIHSKPSDLDLFFLLALAEYLAVTGDAEFLNQSVQFYPGLPQRKDRTVLNHARLAFDHLIHDIGLGENDLLRAVDGDWSDDLIVRHVFPLAPLISPGLSIKYGESIPNSQMALYVLPRIANTLATLNLPAAGELADHMHAEIDPFLARLRDGIRAQWNGKFYARATLRYWWNGKYILHPNTLDLEGQVWALISSFDPDTLGSLKTAVYDTCDNPSPIGATMVDGSIWPAIAQLLTWGYTRVDPHMAWRSFYNQTFANKASVYGSTWLNIWSGPDGLKGARTSEPGGTYNSAPVTPMTDFPIMNNNQHAMSLLALLRVCGIEPAESGDGLCIAPQVPDQYALDLPILKLEVAPDRIRGEYRAQNAGARNLYIRLPSRATGVHVVINGTAQVADFAADGFVRLALPPFTPGETISFEVAASLPHS